MKKMKILIVILVIIIIATIVSIVILKTMNPGDFAKMQKLATPAEEREISPEELKEITRLDYNSVTSAVTTYIQTLNKNNPLYLANDEEGNAISILTEEEKNQRVIDLLSKEYIKENNITTKNLEKYITLEKEQLLFVPTKMKSMNTGEIKTYAVQGILENIQYQFDKEICLIVIIDYQNKTFAIEPTNQKYDEIETIRDENIKENDNNKYSTITVNIENIAKDYINLYKRLALAKPELAYEFLDQEYREKRFGDLEVFEKYIDSNKEEIKKLAVEQYQVNTYSDYSEYVVKDKYENVYVFDEKAVLDFTFKLDTYTLPTDKFKEEYDKVEQQQKVMMNVDKWVQMLNNRDYKSAYEVLDNTFRNNYFGTQEQFETKMKAIFPLRYKVEYGEFSEEGNTYMQEITLSDVTGEQEGGIQTTAIMQLKDDYQFVMALEIK